MMRNKKLLTLLGVLGVIAVVAIIGSALFYVRTVDADIMNAPDAAFQRRVIEAADARGGSIFFKNEADITKRVEDAIPEVRVVNIERVFPDKLVLHVVRKFAYAYIEQNGSYYTLDNDLRVLSVEAVAAGNRPDLVRIYIDKDMSNPILNPDGVVSADVGAPLTTNNGGTVAVLSEVFRGLERLSYKTEVTAFIDSVYVYSGKELVYLQLKQSEGSATRGTVIEISYTARLADKIRAGMSLYVNGDDKNPAYARGGGVIRVWAESGNVKVSYDKDASVAALG
jgi:hypothetical protein